MSEEIIDWIDWIISNKNWIFSGIGLFIFSALIYRRKKYTEDHSINSVSNHKVETKNVWGGVGTVIGDVILKDVEKSSNERGIQISTEPNEIDEVVDRFISVYTNHGVNRSQISSFMDGSFNFKISDFRDNNSVMNILDNEILNWTCSTFGIQREWLDGLPDKEIYPYVDYYKGIDRFIKFVYEFKVKYGRDFRAYVIKSEELDKDSYSPIATVFRYPIKKLNNETIYAYIPTSEHWKWGYINTRYQLKMIVYVCDRLDVYIDGYDRDKDTVEKLIGRSIFPGPVIEKKPGIDWYPVDYIDLPNESVKAKDTSEAVDVRKDIAEQYLTDLADLKFEDYDSCKKHKRMIKQLNKAKNP